MAVDLASLSYTLSSIASAGKILESALSLLAKGEGFEPATLKQEADRAVARSMAEEDAGKFEILAASIPQQILDAGEKAVKKVLDGIANAISTEMPLVEREQRLIAHQRDLCHYLSELSRFGPLPDTLMALWNSSKCAEKGFVLH